LVRTLDADFRFICMNERTFQQKLPEDFLTFCIVLTHVLYKLWDTSCIHFLAKILLCCFNNT